MTSLTYVRLPEPVALSMSAGGQRPRVISSGTQISDSSKPLRPSSFPHFPLLVHMDPQRRTILAYLPPIPTPIPLYDPADFDAAAADTMADHAERVLAILGRDPAAFLQALIDLREAPAPPPRVPREISNWRAKAVLHSLDLLPKIDAFLAALPEPQKSLALLAWNGDAKIRRDSPLITTMSDMLALSPEVLDSLFVQANTLVL